MSDKAVGVAQIGLSVLFVGGYFAVLILFLLGFVKVPTDYKEAFMALLGVSTASVVQIVSYWFARQRSGGSNA